MDRLDALRLFIRIVELGSFTRAAAELAVPRATATHAIKALEIRLGIQLLERTTRQVCATPSGKAYYDSCTRLLVDLDEAEASLALVKGGLHGTLRIDLQEEHAFGVVLPRIDEFRQRHPQVDLEISHGARLSRLVREGVDCIIRSGALHDLALETRQIAPIPQLICASPQYLQQRGVPRHPLGLVGHDAVGGPLRDREGLIDVFVDGERQSYRLRTTVNTEGAQSQVICAARGGGLVQLPRFQVESELRQGLLTEVLAAWESPAQTVSVLYPALRRLTPSARAFVDWVTELYLQRFGVSLRGKSAPR